MVDTWFQAKSSFQQLSNLVLASLALSVPGVLIIAILILSPTKERLHGTIATVIMQMQHVQA